MSPSGKQQDERARLQGEFDECRRRIASTEAELRRIGAAFVTLGNQLQSDPSGLSSQRLAVEKDMAVLWLLLPEYLEALRHLDAKQAELESLK